MTTTLHRIRALEIQRSLGTKTAAAYLRNQGWSLEGAVAYLARTH
jgi:hypothetical protein